MPSQVDSHPHTKSDEYLETYDISNDILVDLLPSHKFEVVNGDEIEIDPVSSIVGFGYYAPFDVFLVLHNDGSNFYHFNIC